MVSIIGGVHGDQMMKMTECNQCGDCCQDINLNWPELDKITGSLTNMWTYMFISQYWYKNANDRYECRFFDRINRVCKTHATRPPICSGFPWYNKEPKLKYLPTKCSFWQDLPFSQRPKEKDAIKR